jgi:hypothetical protein
MQPSAAAFDRGRRAMLATLEADPPQWTPLTAARFAPGWAIAAAAAAAFMLLLGGAGASAALGGPDPAGDVLSEVGVNTDTNSNDAHGGIGQSSASDRGLECANPNAFEGSANSQDKAQNAEEAHQKESCSQGAGQGEHTNEAGPETADANRGHGNDADHTDEDNPGQGQGNHGTNPESNAGGNGDANPNGQENGNPNGNGNPNPGEPQGQGNGLDKNKP